MSGQHVSNRGAYSMAPISLARTRSLPTAGRVPGSPDFPEPGNRLGYKRMESSAA